MNRHHAAEAYAGLKAASRLAVRDVGGVQALAACTRTHPSMASEYGNPGSDRFMPIDVAIDVDAITGTPRIIEAMARALGFQLCPITPTDGELTTALARIGTGTGKLFATMAEAFADGVITDAERYALARDLDELLRVAMGARQVLQRLPVPPADAPQEG